jgi:hypothetical protein
MPFPTQNMTKVAFRGLIVDYYWPDLIRNWSITSTSDERSRAS